MINVYGARITLIISRCSALLFVPRSAGGVTLTQFAVTAPHCNSAHKIMVAASVRETSMGQLAE